MTVSNWHEKVIDLLSALVGTEPGTVGGAVGSGEGIESSGTIQDGSGVIAVASQAQTVFGSVTKRSYLLIQNTSELELWFEITGTAAVLATPSIRLRPGETFTMEQKGSVSSEAISIIGASEGQVYTAKQIILIP